MFSFTRLRKRHKLSLITSLTYELFVRAYQLRGFRTAIKYFFRQQMPKEVFFVLGCYNAGTTVVKEAIGLHPDIVMAPVEGDLLTDAMKSYEYGGWPRCMVGNCYGVRQERLHGTVSAPQIISDLRPWMRKGKSFLEKSISNTVRIPLLRKAFPTTKFICVVREPEAVIRGIQKRSQPTGMASNILDMNYYPDELLLRQWVFFYQTVLDDYAKNCADIYFCSYEKFTREPNVELEEIFKFLDLRDKKPHYLDGQLTVGDRTLTIHSRSEECKDYLSSAGRIQEQIDSIVATL